MTETLPSRATGVHGGFLMDIPAPAQYFNFIFVFVIHRLTVDAVNFRENIIHISTILLTNGNKALIYLFY